MIQYLCIKPEVYIWKDKKNILFYNSITFQSVLWERNSESDTIVDALLDVKNFYSIDIGDKKDSDIVQEITKKGFGVIVDTSDKLKPITIPPVLIFSNRAERVLSKGLLFYDAHLVDYIKTITIRLSGSCRHDCTDCSSLFRQVTNCTKRSGLLTKEDLLKIRTIIHGTKAEKVQFIISSEKDVALLEQNQFIVDNSEQLVINYINWRNVSEEIIDRIESLSCQQLVKIVFKVDACILDDAQMLLRKLLNKYKNIIVCFLLSSDEDVASYQDLEQSLDITDRNEVHCVFNGNNHHFIETFYQMNEQELSSLQCDSDSIKTSQVINSEFWGSIYIEPDRTICLNENYPCFGDIDTPLYEILSKAFNSNDNPWLLTRKKFSCGTCAYRYLCPPINNLELSMSEPFACSSHHKSL